MPDLERPRGARSWLLAIWQEASIPPGRLLWRLVRGSCQGLSPSREASRVRTQRYRCVYAQVVPARVARSFSARQRGMLGRGAALSEPVVPSPFCDTHEGDRQSQPWDHPRPSRSSSGGRVARVQLRCIIAAYREDRAVGAKPRARRALLTARCHQRLGSDFSAAIGWNASRHAAERFAPSTRAAACCAAPDHISRHRMIPRRRVSGDAGVNDHEQDKRVLVVA